MGEWVDELYFAYGSNMSTTRLVARIDPVRALGRALLPDHLLTFDKPGQDGSGKANVRARTGQRVHGVLWSVGATHLLELDGFEPGYERRLLGIRGADGRVLPAWVYLHGGVPAALEPTPTYLGHLLAGAREHGLPSDWVARLERWDGTGAFEPDDR